MDLDFDSVRIIAMAQHHRYHRHIRAPRVGWGIFFEGREVHREKRLVNARKWAAITFPVTISGWRRDARNVYSPIVLGGR